jgi:hypothetical protein
MNKLLTALAVAGALAISPAFAHADTIYNLTLTPYYGPAGGTGTLDLNSAPSASGLSVYLANPTTANTIESLNFSLDGGQFTFNLGEADGTANTISTNGTQATFLNGALIALTYNANIASLSITLDSGSLYYTFTDTANQSDSTSGYITQGAITTSSPAAAPEPSSLIFLGTGVLGLAGVVRRRIVA